MTTTRFVNGTVFTGAAGSPAVESFTVSDGVIVAVGSEAADDVVGAGPRDGHGPRTVDLGGRFVQPGFVEGHVHTLMLGETLDKVALYECRSVAEVQAALVAARERAPRAPRILGVGWRPHLFRDGTEPTAAMIDRVIDDVPVVLDASNLHSAWANTAGLHAMGITGETPDPVGGRIARDEHGYATGYLEEAAATHHAWGYLASVSTPQDRDRYLDNAFRAYLEAGTTAVTDMSFTEEDLACFRRRLDRDGRLPLPVDAYWLLTATGDVAADRAQIRRAVAARDELRAAHGQRWLRIVGVKFILDGIIDTCTAAMREPFVTGEQPGPIWTPDVAVPAAVAADAAGLQLALHAIGDAASTLALDMVQACVDRNPAWDRRPRVEHLESVAPDTVQRMARLGVTASMQPVHCDPAVLENWKDMLGAPRSERGFPWQGLREAGVPVVIGTDAPTAPHQALRNLFIATTARSAWDADLDPYHPERVFTPDQALEASTVAGARAVGRDHEWGRIAVGQRANFCVLDTHPLTDAPEALLETRVLATYVAGERVWPESSAGGQRVDGPG